MTPLFLTSLVLALQPSTTLLINDCPPQYVVCLTEPQRDEVTKAVQELKDIKDSQAVLEIQDPIIIIRDWQDRVYIDGGDKKPLRLKLKLGTTIERDMEATLPIQVAYREQPPDPMFRLRIKAESGVLVPQLIKSFGGESQQFLDIGAGVDFFHLGPVNTSVHAGIRSVGLNVGLDITKNFGPFAGYALIYDGVRSSILTGLYFSFN
jgi:hypothetical protein